MSLTRVPALAEWKRPSPGLLWGLLLFLASILLLPRLLHFTQITFSLISWPWQFDFTEGVNLSATVHLAHGDNIYRHNGPDSFISIPYTPLFSVITAPFTWITGPSFTIGRTISFLCTLSLAALLAYSVSRATKVWFAGVLSGFLWLSLSPVIVWAALYTQHMLALAFSFAGLAWVMFNPTGRRVYIGVAFFWLAFYTKQSAVDVAAATTLWLILREPRTGLKFAGVLIASVGVPFAAVTVLSKGGFWEHVIGYQVLPWAVDRFTRLTGRLWEEYWPLVLWGTGSLFVALAATTRQWRDVLRNAQGTWGMAALYFIAAETFMLARLGRDGVNYNHLIDGLLPLCLLAGLSAGWLGKQATRAEVRRPAIAICAVLIGFLFVAQLLAFRDAHTWYRGLWPGARNDAYFSDLSRLVAITPGNIYSEDPYLVLSNNRPLLYDDASTFGPMADLGRWDESQLLDAMQQRKFGLVILQHDSRRMPQKSWQAFLTNYDMTFRSTFDTFTPKPHMAPQHEASCTLSGDGESVSLLGYTLSAGVEQTGVRGGQLLETTLYWQPQRPLKYSYTSYVQLVSAENERVAAQDNPETGAGQPTTAWEPGKLVMDKAGMYMPPDLAQGRYRLLVGMYRIEGGTLKGLPAQCEKTETYGESVSLGWIDVK